MASKTYKPKLRDLVVKTQKYSTRWNSQLNSNMTPEQYTALQDYIAKGVALLNVLPPEPLNP